MKHSKRGLLIGAAQILLVMSLGAKLLIDRTRYPRVWVEVAPFDPSLPIRGRYVRLKIIGTPQVSGARIQTDQPLAYFIPDGVPDPSHRPSGEELWAEVTVPKKGPPRPIRLGVKKNGVLTPLALSR